MSIFVNPLQFGPAEDLDRYPRALEADLEMCREEGVELVFAPDVDDMYPPGRPPRSTRARSAPSSRARHGPGHFAGMLTVVAKLFPIVVPDVAFFGEKDYQQLTLIRRMVRDLDITSHVVGVPTVREPDGLALSSRNAYLDGRRAGAPPRRLQRALAAGAAVRRGGRRRWWPPRARSSTPSRASRSTTSSCATPTSGRRPEIGPRPAARRRPARAPPG